MSILSIVDKIKKARLRLIKALCTTDDKTLTELTEAVLLDNVVEPENPEDCYSRTRPSSWLSIPTLETDEIVILIELPTVIKFNINTPFTYEGQQYPAGDSKFTLSGQGQNIFKIKGVNSITSFSFLDDTNNNKKGNYKIKEIVWNTPNLTNLSFGGSPTNNPIDCIQCEYITFINENITNMNNLFSRNQRLKTVMGLDYSKVTSCQRSFRFCSSLETLGMVDLYNSTDANRLFDSTGLREIKVMLNTPSEWSVLCGWCPRLINVDILINRIVNLEDAFNSSDSVQRVIIRSNSKVDLNNFLTGKNNFKFLKLIKI